VWGVTVLDVNRHPQNISDLLVHKVKERMGRLNKGAVVMACKHFMSRIEALVEADGDFIV
jgi:Asp/Glu/hydantoin racemase